MAKSVKAIVYVSNTGFTSAYAHMLGEKTGLAVYPLEEAVRTLERGTEIVYMGWLMAGSVCGYKKAAKYFCVAAVCGVGLGDTGAQMDSVRKASSLSADMPLFTLQGGMDHGKLKGMYKSMISILTKVLTRKKNRTADEDGMLALLQRGGNYVSEENLAAVLKWYQGE